MLGVGPLVALLKSVGNELEAHDQQDVGSQGNEQNPLIHVQEAPGLSDQTGPFVGAAMILGRVHVHRRAAYEQVKDRQLPEQRQHEHDFLHEQNEEAFLQEREQMRTNDRPMPGPERFAGKHVRPVAQDERLILDRRQDGRDPDRRQHDSEQHGKLQRRQGGIDRDADQQQPRDQEDRNAVERLPGVPRGPLVRFVPSEIAEQHAEQTACEYARQGDAEGQEQRIFRAVQQLGQQVVAVFVRAERIFAARSGRRSDDCSLALIVHDIFDF